MKQVIKRTQDDVTFVDEVNARFYYGVLEVNYEGKSVQKGFIVQQAYRNGPFIAVCENSMTVGNNWDSYSCNTLEATVDAIIKSGCKKQVFQFDTAKELFAWLAE